VLRRGAVQEVRVLDAGGVELASGLSEDLSTRRVLVEGGPVRPRLDHGAERIDHGDDARTEWDPCAMQPVRVAGAVPALVMASDDCEHVGGGKERREQARPFGRVEADGGPFRVVERPGLREDGLRNRELPDVVQFRRELERLELARREPKSRADADAQPGDLQRVRAKQAVTRARAREERLDRARLAFRADDRHRVHAALPHSGDASGFPSRGVMRVSGAVAITLLF
jgi:hypothetical protein